MKIIRINRLCDFSGQSEKDMKKQGKENIIELQWIM